MADTIQLSFVDFSKVPSRIWDSTEGVRIKETLGKMKAVMGDNLEKVDLFPNAGHVSFGTAKILNGAIYHVKKGAPMKDLLQFLGPLYQYLSVFDLGKVSEEDIAKCKGKWNNIIDPADAKGSGIPGYGVNVHRESDILDLYQKRGEGTTGSWYTSLGAFCPSNAILTKDKLGDVKLVLSGGHEQLQNRLTESITEDLKIEDIADMNSTLDVDRPLGLLVKTIKDLQIVNQSRIASKVITALGMGKHKSDPYQGFTAPVDIPYGCFYNTIHESPKRNDKQSSNFIITQGIANTGIDLTEQKEEPLAKLYIIENPKKVQELTIHRSFLSKVRYFPITTGSSELASIGMKTEEKTELEKNLHFTGVCSVHNISDISYQPYDSILKGHTNTIFGGSAYAAISSDQTLEGVVYSIPGIDPRSLSVEDYIKYTRGLGIKDLVKAPVNSQPTDLIFRTFPKMLDILHGEGIKTVELANVLKTSKDSNYFVEFPAGSLRLAKQLSDQGK